MAKRKVTKEQSPLQKVCMAYGRACWEAASTDGLVRLLRKQGKPEVAEVVEAAVRIARGEARYDYFQQRKALQPDWKDWTQQNEERLAQLDKEEGEK